MGIILQFFKFYKNCAKNYDEFAIFFIKFKFEISMDLGGKNEDPDSKLINSDPDPSDQNKF